MRRTSNNQLDSLIAFVRGRAGWEHNPRWREDGTVGSEGWSYSGADGAFGNLDFGDPTADAGDMRIAARRLSPSSSTKQALWETKDFTPGRISDAAEWVEQPVQ